MNKFWDLIEKITVFFLRKVFRLKISDEAVANLVQFIKFGIIGVSNTVVSYGVYTICYFILTKNGLFPKTDYMISQIISFLISVLWSYYWNNRYVFTEDEANRSWWKALLKTYVSYSFTGLFLNTVLLALWVDVLGISGYIAPIINIPINVPINFLLNKFWAFRGKK